MTKEVLFVLDDFSGGGAAKVISLISNCLIERGYRIILVTDISISSIYYLNPEIKILPLYNGSSKDKSYIKKIWQSTRNLRHYLSNYNGIVVGVMSTMSLVLWLASFGKKNIKIASDHTSFDRKLSLYARFLRSYVYNQFDAVTILTKADALYLGDKLPKKKIIPNPISNSFYDNYENREHVILGIGRLDVWYLKGFDLLFKAWSKISSKHTDWHIEIAGGGSEESIRELKRIAIKYGVSESVKFIGIKKDIYSVMRRSSIFVLTSRVEGFGLVLAESMSQGCACISFDCGGRQKEIISNNNEGIIIENHDVDVLAEKLEYLILNKEQRKMLSHNAVERSKIFSVDSITDKWISLFKDLEKINNEKN